ncbi:hypothetical protein ASD25_04425 [Brevundimonas sp. Root1423]|nr:hypothetical protein ASD25_04425 [Brevundimonas sp. Root1423]
MRRLGVRGEPGAAGNQLARGIDSDAAVLSEADTGVIEPRRVFKEQPGRPRRRMRRLASPPAEQTCSSWRASSADGVTPLGSPRSLAPSSAIRNGGLG